MPTPIIKSPSETLLRAIVGSICRRSKNPSIVWSDSFNFWIITGLEERDHGRLIGKGGSTFYALETAMWYAGITHATAPESVKLMSQPKVPNSPPKSPFKPNPNWDRKALGKLVDAITLACLNRKVPWSIEDDGEASGVVSIELERYLQNAMSEPDFQLSLKTLLHSAAMSDGASVVATILWK